MNLIKKEKRNFRSKSKADPLSNDLSQKQKDICLKKYMLKDIC